MSPPLFCFIFSPHVFFVSHLSWVRGGGRGGRGGMGSNTWSRCNYGPGVASRESGKLWVKVRLKKCTRSFIDAAAANNDDDSEKDDGYDDEYNDDEYNDGNNDFDGDYNDYFIMMMMTSLMNDEANYD